MGRVRGSTDRVCVGVGGPIDFLAHVKAAREEPPFASDHPQPPTTPFDLLRPPTPPSPPPTQQPATNVSLHAHSLFLLLPSPSSPFFPLPRPRVFSLFPGNECTVCTRSVCRERTYLYPDVVISDRFSIFRTDTVFPTRTLSLFSPISFPFFSSKPRISRARFSFRITDK